MLRRLIAPSLLIMGLGTAALADQRIDENALRYYASLGQRDRVVAETRRLKRIDPSWHAPDDLYTARPGRADEGPLWALYSLGRLDDLAAAIALRKTAEPAWQPSEDLVAKIKAKALHAQIMDLAKAQDWRGIVQSFKVNGIAWAKDDAEALWIVAEAYARGNDCSEAYIVYRGLLTDHTDPGERRATIERAIAFIPMALTEKLIAMGHTDAEGRSEFAPIATDIARARISAFLHDEPTGEVSDEDLKRLQDVVRGSTDPNAAGLVAWYAFKRRDYSQALDWFKLAIANGGDAMIAHGLAHTLDRLGMKREAEEVAYAWREPLVNNAILFIDLLQDDLTKAQPPFIEPARVARYAQVTIATESGEGAQALAWYAYNTCQYPLALQWFERANAWLPKEATAYGYALSLQRLHRGREFRDVVNRYDGLFPKVVALAFDDGIRRPPPPCETNTRQPAAPPREPARPISAGADWTGRTMADTLRPQTTGARGARDLGGARFERTRVPSPEAVVSGADDALPALKKKIEFPVAVASENPLRFSALHSGAVTLCTGIWPLVARRVPGVGAMPYERYGFTLLPGWDGTKEASQPSAAERSAPSGTLWAIEQSLHDRSDADPSAKGAETLARQPMAKASSDTSLHSDRRS